MKSDEIRSPFRWNINVQRTPLATAGELLLPSLAQETLDTSIEEATGRCETDHQKRSNKTIRTPPNESTLKTSQRLISNSLTELRSRTVEPTLALTHMERLGKQLDELSEFIKNKSNVHHEIRRLLTSIRSTYRQAVQTQEVLKDLAAQDEKILQEAGDIDTPRGKRKRSTKTPTSGGNESKKGKTSEVKLQSQKKIENPLQVEVADKEDTKKATNWTVVKKKSRKRRERPPRPDALEITKTGNLTYAEILRNMKSNPDLKDLGETVTRIRKTEKGSLLLELGKTADENTPALHASFEKILGKEAEVKTLKEMDEILIEIKDID